MTLKSIKKQKHTFGRVFLVLTITTTIMALMYVVPTSTNTSMAQTCENGTGYYAYDPQTPGETPPCIAAAPSPTADQAASKGAGDGSKLITEYLSPFINFLAGIVGLVVTISIVVGGIQYASSADDPSKVNKAKQRIYNAIIALLAFLFLYLFLQWIIPGGILNTTGS
jgi:hypothetical protein